MKRSTLNLIYYRTTILVCLINIFFITPILAFGSSPNTATNTRASSIQRNDVSFRSAKKISGASSHVPSIPTQSTSLSSQQRTRKKRTKSLQSTSSDAFEVEETDDEDIEPGKMRVSEIKAELDLREVSYKDCFDKEALVQRLQEARATGKANPAILEKFNKQNLEQTFNPDKKVDLNDEDIAKAVANDGKLPGGLSPDQFKRLAGNPEIMSLLQSTKMQDAMKLMMTGGRDELENKLKEDPELQETLTKLDSILKGTM